MAVESGKTREELQRENEELRAFLTQVLKAYAILDEAIRACPAAIQSDTDATVGSAAEVKRLLEKYSKL